MTEFDDTNEGGDETVELVNLRNANKFVSSEAAAIKLSQERFWTTVNRMTELYRNLHKTRRADIKKRMKELYEDLKMLAETIGIGRVSLDNLWAG